MCSFYMLLKSYQVAHIKSNIAGAARLTTNHFVSSGHELSLYGTSIN